MNKYYFFFVFLISFGFCPSYGSEVNDLAETAFNSTKEISFSEALAHALDNNSGIRKYRAMLEIAVQKKTRARSHLFPRLDLTSTTQEIKTYNNLPGLESLILSGRDKAYQSTTSQQLKLNIYNGGADAARIQLADEQIKEAYLKLDQEMVSISLLVLDSVHKIRLSGIELHIARLQLELSKKELEQASKKKSLERMSDLSFAEFEYNYRRKELNLRTKKRAYDRALKNLATVIETKDDLPERKFISSAREKYVDVLSQFGFDNVHPQIEIEILNSKIEQARINKERARSAYFPKVDLVASLSYAGISESDFDQAFEDQRKDTSVIGVTFKWNLFDGFDTTAGVEESVQRIIAAQASRDQAMGSHRKEQTLLRSRLKDSEDQLFIEREHLELLQMKMQINRKKFGLGRIDAVKFLTVETELEIQKLDYESSEEQVAYYKAKLFLRREQE